MSAVMPRGWWIGPAVSGRDDKVWINCPDGEGGDFCRAEFEAVLTSGFVTGDMEQAISRFFWENF